MTRVAPTSCRGTQNNNRRSTADVTARQKSNFATLKVVSKQSSDNRSNATGASTVTHKSACKLNMMLKKDRQKTGDTPKKKRYPLKRMLSEGEQNVDEERSTLAILVQNVQNQAIAGHLRQLDRQMTLIEGTNSNLQYSENLAKQVGFAGR